MQIFKTFITVLTETCDVPARKRETFKTKLIHCRITRIFFQVSTLQVDTGQLNPHKCPTRGIGK